ncbi:type VI secretion system Vgr family protein [Desulfovibrio inopinatus]|uniref:type VI secretion system Vgr family protein n=1 Tax=Desulfovibrio inopinatus TaxID=102109 RepID=UPI0004068424|nr:type VI secretion system tip protein TssI/VgrG [Desulfovibrio inopinatus]
MPTLFDMKTRFVSSAVPEDTFHVVSFSGSEGLCRLFEFNILLSSDNADIDLDAVMDESSTFTIERGLERDDITFEGVLARFDQEHKVGTRVFYRAVLVPKAWWLSLTQYNQIFLNKTVPDILKDVLVQSGLEANDFDFRLQNSYSEREYVCQYDETHFNFFMRWLEYEGMYFFFESGQGGMRLVVTDTLIAHQPSPYGDRVHYTQPSGLGESQAQDLIWSLVCRKQRTPSSVLVKDYMSQTPDLDIRSQKPLERGVGETYFFGDNVRNESEAQKQSRIRSEEIHSGQTTFFGEGYAASLRPGFLFTVHEHYRKSFNSQYLIVSIDHEGMQPEYLETGTPNDVSQMKPRYSNSFTAVPQNIQYRPQRRTRKPRVSGSITATIDAAGSGEYAEVDNEGRYKVIMPFDLSGRGEGQASCPVRMAQPYAGNGFGMHFPLHKGCEVLINFLGGDPDRPYISGAVPNPAHPSPVTSSNKTQSRITTSGQNKIHIEDQEGTQRILMSSPTASSWYRMGAPNDPPSGDDDDKDTWGGENGHTFYTTGGFSFKGQAYNELILGEKTETVLGGYAEVIVGSKNEVNMINSNALTMAITTEGNLTRRFSYGPLVDKAEEEKFETNVERLIVASNHVATIDNKITTANQKITTADQKIQTLETKVDTAEQKITTANQKIETIDQKITTANEKIETVDQKVSTANEKIETVDQKVTTTNQRVDTVDQKIVTANQKIETLDTRIGTAETELTTATSRIQTNSEYIANAMDIILG